MPVLAGLCAALGQAPAETRLILTPVGPEATLYDPAISGCDANDIPDAPFRAFRDAGGGIVAFGLHFDNRRLIGPDLGQLKPDCRIVLESPGNPDPAAYADRSWVAAVHSPDGKRVDALVHHEFQAHRHKGRCRYPDYLPCWWNSVTAHVSTDSGGRFAPARPFVAAASPGGSEAGQGRHRGFFNPSNLIARDGHLYALIATTGWNGQSSGVCLFRRAKAGGQWRAFDGAGFGAAFPDPYRRGAKAGICRALAPFPSNIGGVVRHKASGLYLAVYQASSGMPDGRGGSYRESGFYAASSRDLVTWSAPHLVRATRTLFDSPCGAARLLNYPSPIDPAAPDRNFLESGDRLGLTYTALPVEGCAVGHARRLLAVPATISVIRAD